MTIVTLKPSKEQKPTMKIKIDEVDTNVKQVDRLRDISDQIPFTVDIQIPGDTAEDDTFYGVVFVAPFQCSLISAKERHSVAGTAGALDVLKNNSDSMIASTFSLTGSANTTVSKDPSSSKENIVLDINDSVYLSVTGTPTDCRNVAVTLLFRAELNNLPE